MANDVFVAPFDVTSFPAGIPTDADSVRVRRILANTNRYALTTWWNAKYAAQTGAYLTLGGNGEGNVRPPASESVALAAALASGGYDPAVTGVPQATALSVTVRLVGSVAKQHIANTAGGWGNGWQTAYWAALAGTAGWLLWNSLTSTDREYVRKMVEYEANRFIGLPVPYWKDRAGHLVGSCSDTKAEESAWNSQLLMLAPVMMPQHSRRSGWAYKANELAVGAYARPADLGSSADVLGRPVTDWLDGTNVNNDGTLINHNKHHPDYATTLVERTFGGVVAALAHRVSPRTVTHNAALVYSMLVDKKFWPPPALPCPGSPVFVAPPANDPDGTCYIDDSAAIYYPEGNDWGTDRRMHFANLDAAARVYAFDSLVAQKAAYWEPFHAQRVLDMQNRSADRRTYIAAAEDTYFGREEWVAVGAAQAWLAKWAASKSAISVQNSLAQIVLDDLDRATSVVGTWTRGTPAANGPQVFGPTVRYKAAGSGTASVTFTPRLSQTRTYKVYGWWLAAPAQATNAPYTVRHATGTTTIQASQRINGGLWNLLGSFSMGAGSYVRLTDAANGYVVADAIMLDPN
jgi:hypothetical protein